MTIVRSLHDVPQFVPLTPSSSRPIKHSTTLHSVLQQYLHHFVILFFSHSHNERSLTLVILCINIGAVPKQQQYNVKIPSNHVHVLRAGLMSRLERSHLHRAREVAEQPLLLLDIMESGYSLELGCHVCAIFEKHPGLPQFDVN